MLFFYLTANTDFIQLQHIVKGLWSLRKSSGGPWFHLKNSLRPNISQKTAQIREKFFRGGLTPSLGNHWTTGGGWNNLNSARVNPSAVSSDVAEKSDPVAGIKNNYYKLIEITSLLTVGLVCLCRPYRGISIKLRLFHNQLKVEDF